MKTTQDEDSEIIDGIAEVMYKSMEPLIKQCIEQRLRQILPLIKEGLLNENAR